VGSPSSSRPEPGLAHPARLLYLVRVRRQRGYTQNMGEDFDVYPWPLRHRYGYTSDHRTHRIS